jgi:hypothetical protein
VTILDRDHVEPLFAINWYSGGTILAPCLRVRIRDVRTQRSFLLFTRDSTFVFAVDVL